jgi:single-stranded-DNA-specific exonuclease
VGYRVLYENTEESLITRLCKVRNIGDKPEDFLEPTFKRYWTPGEVLSDYTLWSQRIARAIRNGEKTMIFGDYDVDGIMASYVMYVGLRQFLWAEQVSVRLPHRAKDGYGIKSYHLDQVAQLWCTLVITVDNGISSHLEANHASTLGVDMVITDHHLPWAQLPQAYAVINPQCSQEYPLKEICWATVALKVVLWVAEALGVDRQVKKDILDWCMPFVAIATVADCMPLIWENRLLVKKWLDMMNNQRTKIAPVLATMLDHLNIQKIDTFHIGFMIAPRLNATGRMDSAELGLQCLLASTYQKQKEYLEQLDLINSQRKSAQDTMIKQAIEQVDGDRQLIWASDETFHEWIIGIVAWRLAEKHKKPTLIMSVDHEKGHAVGSLRGPAWWDIVGMLRSAEDLLLRFGGHAQAWWLTVATKNIPDLIKRLEEHCENNPVPITDDETCIVDTTLYTHEMNAKVCEDIGSFGPYGEANPEPEFIVKDVSLLSISKVGKNWNWHLKLRGKAYDKEFEILQRWKWDAIEKYTKWAMVDIIGKPKVSTYSNDRFIDGTHVIETIW